MDRYLSLRAPEGLPLARPHPTRLALSDAIILLATQLRHDAFLTSAARDAKLRELNALVAQRQILDATLDKKA